MMILVLLICLVCFCHLMAAEEETPTARRLAGYPRIPKPTRKVGDDQFMKKILIVTCSVLSLASVGWGQTNVDNTAKNARDQNGKNLTAVDQSNAPADLKITAETRQKVVGDKSLSFLAKNAKIITVNEVVTLRGPVESKKEKVTIAGYAKAAGAKKVINELEIKAP